MATTSGLYRSSLPRDPRANQIRLFELFKAGALQTDDVFHFDKCVEVHSGGVFQVLVDATAVIRAQDKAAIKGTITAIDFDILENSQRSLLGAFTGARTLAEVLTRRAGGLPANALVTNLCQPWEDFQVWRNGQCLGTAADVRNHYYVTHKRGIAPVTRATRNLISADVTTADLDLSNSAPRTPREGLAIPSNVTTAATNTPALSDVLSNLHLAPLPRRLQPTTATVLNHTKSARQCKKSSDTMLEDSLMRELFDAIHDTYRPERYNKKHTAIRAKDYIQFLERRIDQIYGMITIMGVTPQSLCDIIRQMNNGVDVADAMRRGLEWDEEEAPLGNPLGLYDPMKQKFNDDDDDDDEMEDDEFDGARTGRQCTVVA